MKEGPRRLTGDEDKADEADCPATVAAAALSLSTSASSCRSRTVGSRTVGSCGEGLSGSSKKRPCAIRLRMKDTGTKMGRMRRMDQANHQKYDTRIIFRFLTIFVKVSPTRVFCSGEKPYFIENRKLCCANLGFGYCCHIQYARTLHVNVTDLISYSRMLRIVIHGFIWLRRNLKSWAHR